VIRTPTEIAETAESVLAVVRRMAAGLHTFTSLDGLERAEQSTLIAERELRRLRSQIAVFCARERQSARADALAGMLSDTANIEALLATRQLESQP
jgi:hypothetical protein